MKKVISLILLVFSSVSVFAQSDPPVKMSSSEICHAQGSTYYSQTKKFTAYRTLVECLEAGGRMPKKSISVFASASFYGLGSGDTVVQLKVLAD